ncbi:MAG: DmsE family decaheme c-type cytochrome [Elusimicrobiota bacterium]
MNLLPDRAALRKVVLILSSLSFAPLLALAQPQTSATTPPQTAPAVQPAPAPAKAVVAAPAEAATEVGASVCASCHTEKADAFKKSWHGRKMPGMKGVDFEKSCESCHGAGSLHVAAAGDKDNPGFATTLITAEKNDRCLTCHNQRKLINWKVSEHNQQGIACAQCHKIHDYAVEAPKPKSEICMDCHKKKRMEASLPFHHPILEGKIECYDCHNPHGGDFRNMAAESVNETCAKCHAEKLGPFQQEHPPVAENCTICHSPHGSINEALLKESQPALCLGCHKYPHAGTNAVNGVPAALLTHSRCTNCHFAIHGNDDGGWFTNH